MLVARERELFARSGVDVEVVDLPSHDALWRSDLDVLHVPLDELLVQVAEKKQDWFAFLALDKGNGMRLYARPGTTLQQLARARAGVGVETDNSMDVIALTWLFWRIEERDFRLVPVGGPSERLKALREGRIAGAILGEPWGERARRAGFAPARELRVEPTLYRVAVARRSLAAKPDMAAALRGYARAELDARAWLRDPANRDEALKILRSADRLDDAEAQALYRAATGPAGMFEDAAVSAAAVESGAVPRAKAGKLRLPTDVVTWSRPGPGGVSDDSYLP